MFKSVVTRRNVFVSIYRLWQMRTYCPQHGTLSHKETCTQSADGRFERAHAGTTLLDEEADRSEDGSG